jgi:hypothetical protein
MWAKAMIGFVWYVFFISQKKLKANSRNDCWDASKHLIRLKSFLLVGGDCEGFC